MIIAKPLRNICQVCVYNLGGVFSRVQIGLVIVMIKEAKWLHVMFEVSSFGG